MDGYMTIGMLVAFQALTYSFLQPVNDLVELGGRLQEARGDINRLDDILQANVDPQTERMAVKPGEQPDFNIITKKLEVILSLKMFVLATADWRLP